MNSDGKLDLILNKLNSFEDRFTAIESKLDRLSSTVSELQYRVSTISSDMSRNTDRIQSLTNVIEAQDIRLR